MPTFSSSDRQVVTIRAPKDRVARALSAPEELKQFLADGAESATPVDEHTLHIVRKPVEEKGVRFRGDYSVRYAYDGAGKVTWSTISTGNMRSRGEAVLTSVGDDATRVEYSEAIECDMECNRILGAVLRPIVERKIKSGIGEYLAVVKRILERG